PPFRVRRARQRPVPGETGRSRTRRPRPRYQTSLSVRDPVADPLPAAQRGASVLEEDDLTVHLVRLGERTVAHLRAPAALVPHALGGVRTLGDRAGLEGAALGPGRTVLEEVDAVLVRRLVDLLQDLVAGLGPPVALRADRPGQVAALHQQAGRLGVRRSLRFPGRLSRGGGPDADEQHHQNSEDLTHASFSFSEVCSRVKARESAPDTAVRRAPVYRHSMMLRPLPGY